MCICAQKFYSYSRSACYKMVKFFFCYIWLGIGFLVVFKIFFSEMRVFEGFPIPLITMLVMMLGEVNYQGKLFPENTEIHPEKEKNEYIGKAESREFLQFAGDL